MKLFILFSWGFFCLVFPTHAQSTRTCARSLSDQSVTSVHEKTADAILGEWLDDQQTVRIQVYRKSARYHARIVWLKDSTIARPNTLVLENLQYTHANSWQKGRLFYPRTDGWYDCRCTLHSPAVMHVRVYIGTPLFGKTIRFSRIDATQASVK